MLMRHGNTTDSFSQDSEEGKRSEYDRQKTIAWHRK